MGRIKTRGKLQQAIYYIPRAKAGPKTGVAAQSLGCDAVEEGGTSLGSPCGAVQAKITFLRSPCGAVEARRTSLWSLCGAVLLEGTWFPPLPTNYCSAAGRQ